LIERYATHSEILFADDAKLFKHRSWWIV